MQLGGLIAVLEDEANAAAALETLGDLVLFAEVQAVGVRYNEAPGEYVSGAVGRFASGASDEDWLGLMNALERSDDPARAVLQYILRWALTQDATEQVASTHGGCSCHAGLDTRHAGG
jgi:hypothetical protein